MDFVLFLIRFNLNRIFFQMLGNLKNPPEPFEDIIRTHFRLKARSITAQLNEWVAQDDGKATTPDGGGYSNATKPVAGSSNNGLRKDVDELKEILAQLQAGEGSSNAV